MKNRTELFHIQMPLSLDCDQGRIGQAQAVFAHIQPGDTLYIREYPGGNPDAVISELLLQAAEISGPSLSQWGGFAFQFNAKTADGSTLNIMKANPRPFDQAVFQPTEQLSALLKASAYFGMHSNPNENAVSLYKLDDAAAAEIAAEIRERRQASAANAAEAEAAIQDQARSDAAHRAPDIVDPVQLFK